MNRLACVITSILAAASRAADLTANSNELAEIVVTAQKRFENAQAVPLSVQVLDNKALEQLEITNFDDYVKFLPSLSSTKSPLGQNQLYIRGVTNGTEGLPVGSQPSVAVYLDEQPVTTISENLDVHIYDIARVEELSGPQGTLYGASSMSGTLRIITNKPSTVGFEAGYDLDLNTVTSANDRGGRVEGFVNLPVSSQAAIRLVGFSEHDPGYINNVLGPHEVWRTSGEVRTNAGLTKKGFNGVDTLGGRAALKVNLSDSWTLMPTVMAQRQTANGFPAYEPALGDLNVATYYPARHFDRWWQSALTVEGKIFNLDLVYAGSYLDRTRGHQIDYSDYYYGYDAYYGAAYGGNFRDDAGNVISPATFVVSGDHFTKASNEIRVVSPKDWRLRFVAGLFAQRQGDNIHDEYTIPNLAASLSITGQPGVEYLNAMSRVDRDKAVFGEVSYDLSNGLTVTAGLRKFSYDNTVYGFFGYNGVLGIGEDLCQPGSAAAGSGRPCINVDQRAAGDGSTHKVNLEYRIDPDRMLYATWSDGFRPGGINRTRDAAPFHPDTLTNFETGWKTTWLAQHLRFNGALFDERWKDAQYTICGPNCIYEVINVGAAEIRGVESELQWVMNSELTVTTSMTWLDAKLTTNACRYGNAGALCNNSAGVADPAVAPIATAGTPLPASKFRGNLIARYMFEVADFAAHLQGALVGQSAILAQPPSITPGALQARNPPGYATLDLTAGLGRGGWSTEVYVKNALDERGQQFRFYFCSLPTCNQLVVGPIPPRILGVSFRQRF
jgi:outer membrane receptor protein involved in Fe transport